MRPKSMTPVLILLSAIGTSACSHTYYHAFRITTDPPNGVSLTQKSTGEFIGKGPKVVHFAGKSDDKCWQETIVAERSGYEGKNKRIKVCPQYEDFDEAIGSPTQIRIVLQPETTIRQKVVREKVEVEDEDSDGNE